MPRQPSRKLPMRSLLRHGSSCKRLKLMNRKHGKDLFKPPKLFHAALTLSNLHDQQETTKMKLAEIANDLEQRRIEILKNNAQRVKQQVKDAQARAKMKKAQEELRKSREASSSNLSLNGWCVPPELTARYRSFAKWRFRHKPDMDVGDYKQSVLNPKLPLAIPDIGHSIKFRARPI